MSKKSPVRELEDRGMDVLRRAGQDPLGAFALRILGPGVRREVARVRKQVAGVIDGFTGALKDAEGEDPEADAEAQVIDAEIVDEPPKR